MTQPSSAPPAAPPPLSQRDAIARAKGVPGGTIKGGEDPDLKQTLARERPWVRMLVAMTIVLVLAGFVLGAIATFLGAIGIGGP
jgi:hypothetical protein